MGYSPWGCKESDTTENAQSYALGVPCQKPEAETIHILYYFTPWYPLLPQTERYLDQMLCIWDLLKGRSMGVHQP